VTTPATPQEAGETFGADALEQVPGPVVPRQVVNIIEPDDTALPLAEVPLGEELPTSAALSTWGDL
jgi:hypothetical protein